MVPPAQPVSCRALADTLLTLLMRTASLGLPFNHPSATVLADASGRLPSARGLLCMCSKGTAGRLG